MLKQRLVKYGLISSCENLKKILKKEWDAIPQQAIQDSVDSWQGRVCRVGKARGCHIEK